MKKTAILIGLVFVASLVVVNAQTKKTTKKKTTPQTTTPSVDTSKTRARRSGTTANETQPAAASAEIPTDKKPETAAPKVESDPKNTETTSTPNDTPAEPEEKKEDKPELKPDDPLASLRDQISATDSGPERIRLQLKLVEELVAAGNKPEALKELHTVSNTDVFDPTGFFNTGNSFARLNDTEGAVEAYRKAIEQRKGRYSRAYNNMGVVLLRVGRWEDAYAAFNAALKLESFRYPEASYNLGRLYAARGQNDLAVREWQRVIALNPEHTAAKDALARVGLNDRVEVKPVKVVSTEAKGAAEKSVAVKSPGAARDNKSLVLNPASYDFLQRARTSTEKGNTVDAIDNYKRLIKREGGYFAPANLELSFALLTVKRYDEALENLQLVSGRDGSRYPISYYHLARVYEQKGELKSAEEAFAKAAAAFGNENSQFLLDLSRVREKQGDVNGALEAMEQYINVMKQQGLEPSWSEQRLTALREKKAAGPKE